MLRVKRGAVVRLERLHREVGRQMPRFSLRIGLKHEQASGAALADNVGRNNRQLREGAGGGKTERDDILIVGQARTRRPATAALDAMKVPVLAAICASGACATAERLRVA